MKILLIDNETTLLDELKRLIPGKEVTRKWNDLQDIETDIYDLIILSGGSKFGVEEKLKELQPEINIILNTNKPIVGICLGAELIVEAYDGHLEKMGNREKGLKTVKVTSDNEVFQGRDSFEAYENHSWKIVNAPDDFEVLAKTNTSIAAVKHKHRPVWGLQFHPEHFVDRSFADEVFMEIFNKYIS
jgi:para-aminobenzoate synthetase